MAKQVPADKPAWDGMLYEAIPIFVAGVASMENQWDAEKLSKKLREYMNKAAKHMNFRGKMATLINEYIDNALGAIFSSLGDREWVPQADMIMLLDAGIKDNFPSVLFRGMTQRQFESIVLAGYERSYDEQKFWPTLTEAMASMPASKTKKKVWTAVDEGRKKTFTEQHNTAEDFVYAWIASSIAGLARVSGWGRGPDKMLPAEELSQIFATCVAGGGVPLKLLPEGQEGPVSIIEEAVQAAYAEHHVPEPEGGWEEGAEGAVAEEAAVEDEVAPPPAKRMKGAYGK